MLRNYYNDLRTFETRDPTRQAAITILSLQKQLQQLRQFVKIFVRLSF